MSRYIDADKLTEAFVKAAKQVGNIGDQIAFRMMINEIPAADVRENVRGEWIKEYLVEDLGIMLYVCDKCAEPTVKKTNFCPNCGADMRGGDAE